ncbi:MULTISPECIES: translesion DNA synthesis-associated protein ImuA [Caldimonas]|jgi:protein ImuA|uniref:translesion DNA synthesis-associated protein ImuA n=1 Tax=Caldimonas TaxID=196013 RepID=UPI0012EAFE11|nr:translesion DNA synthesis-associated protein ImuA [Caldimonas manganoxidans]MCX7660156.1 translesion DNA synthesis-associated protein ImuA [Caldimonas manganoxidans]GIX23321.1 MAG: hypothetical protein KatS3mg122_0552 [Caldimonas sp.]
MLSRSLSSEVAAAVWQGDALPGAHELPVCPTGFAALDAVLPGGGWPVQGLSEILLPAWGLAECRLTAPALSRVLADEGPGKAVLFIGPPAPPHAPGWRAAGLNADSMIWVNVVQPEQRLWAAAQALHCAEVAAVLLWLPVQRGQVAGLRRLQVRSLQGQRLVFVFRPLAVQVEASPAPLRLAVQASRPLSLVLRLLKRRGPPHDRPIEVPAAPQDLAEVLSHALAARGGASAVSMQRFDVGRSLLDGVVPSHDLRAVTG